MTDEKCTSDNVAVLLALLCDTVSRCRLAAALLVLLINVGFQVLRALLCRAFNADVLAMKQM